MDLATLLRNIDAQTARAFVSAARHLIDALLIEVAQGQALHTPKSQDYDVAELSRVGSPGGWLTHDELHLAAQRMAEAIATERWVDGVLAALRTFNVLGGVGR